jgi:predicted ATP-dependent serine protease
LIQGGTREQFDLLIANAVQLDVPTVVSLGQALDRLEEEKALDREDDGQMPTPRPSLNRRLGHWRGGNLIVLSGPQGTGKTTCALCIAAHHAAHALPSLI